MAHERRGRAEDGSGGGADHPQRHRHPAEPRAGGHRAGAAQERRAEPEQGAGGSQEQERQVSCEGWV